MSLHCFIFVGCLPQWGLSLVSDAACQVAALGRRSSYRLAVLVSGFKRGTVSLSISLSFSNRSRPRHFAILANDLNQLRTPSLSWSKLGTCPKGYTSRNPTSQRKLLFRKRSCVPKTDSFTEACQLYTRLCSPDVNLPSEKYLYGFDSPIADLSRIEFSSWDFTPLMLSSHITNTSLYVIILSSIHMPKRRELPSTLHLYSPPSFRALSSQFTHCWWMDCSRIRHTRQIHQNGRGSSMVDTSSKRDSGSSIAVY